jgi:hypothetical protein
MGLYKSIKARNLTIMTEKRRSLLDQTILKATLPRLQELGLQRCLADIAFSEPAWQKAISTLAWELKKRGLPLEIPQDVPLPPMARSYLLERNLRHLAKLQDPQSPPPELGELQPLFNLLVEKKTL